MIWSAFMSAFNTCNEDYNDNMDFVQSFTFINHDLVTLEVEVMNRYYNCLYKEFNNYYNKNV